MRVLLAAPLILALLYGGALHAEDGVSEELMPFLSSLAGEAGYGVQSTERGAFLVREADGGIRCILWPVSGEFHRASWKGSMPAFTVAIAHTHPICCPEASQRDRRLAETLGMSVITVSRASVHIVDGGGKAARLRRSVQWSRYADDAMKCAAAPAAAESLHASTAR